MEDLRTEEKYIDESRQGEAFEMEVQVQGKKKIFLESYGCAMNFADSEVIASIMIKDGYTPTKDLNEADAIFINTCAIRDKAEQTVRNRLKTFDSLKAKKPELIVGVLGCMAERLKKNLLEEEKIVDVVVGPDAYRDLPKMMETVESGQKAVNVFLSREETYGDIEPIRLDSNGVTAFISIMRGCNNMCSFCVVPYTRGRERSRDPQSIVREAQDLVAKGYKEVTLLGQNVDSYHWKPENGSNVNFANLLEMVALISPDLRVRFSTSHPKDISEEVVRTIAKYENICNYIHLPVQSGNTRVLGIMNRTYTREWYLEQIKMIRSIIPDVGISSDLIAGFCTETEEEHRDTLSLMEEVQFEYAYMYMYSERPGTPAAKKFKDDVPEEVKSRRLQEIIGLQRTHSLISNQRDVGKTFKVLAEGFSKKSDEMLRGRNDQNKMVLFPKENFKAGDYVMVKVEECTGGTLIGKAVSA